MVALNLRRSRRRGRRGLKIPFSIKFGVETLSRHPGRVALSIIGVTLAATLLSAANISVDVSSGRALEIALEDTPIDYVMWSWKSDEIDPEGVAAQVLEVDGVNSAEIVCFLKSPFEIWIQKGGETYEIPLGDVVGIQPSFSELAPDLGISTNRIPDLAPGEVLVSTESLTTIQDILGREPCRGDVLNATIWLDPSTPNVELTFVGTFLLDEEKFQNALGGLSHPDIIMSLETATEVLPHIQARLRTYVLTPYHGRTIRIPYGMISFLLKVERSHILAQSPPRTLRQLDSFGSRIRSQAGVRLDYFSSIEITTNDYAERMKKARPIYLVASLPVVLLGIYLGMVGLDFSYSNRRMALSLFKSRGFGITQIAHLLIVEVAVIGIIAGVLGFIFGSLAASFVPVPGRSGLGVLSFSGISPNSLAFSIIAAIGMMLAACLKPIRKLRAMTIKDLLQPYTVSLSKDTYNPKTDLILVMIPLTIYLSILTMGAPKMGMPILVRLTAGILFVAGLALMPITPIMFSLGLSRILTRGTTKPYAWISSLLQPLLRDLGPTPKTNLLRHPERSSRIAILVSLSIAFGIVMVTIPSSQIKLDRAEHVFSVGSDIVAMLDQSSDPSIPIKIDALEGVDTLSILYKTTETRYGFRVVIVDPRSLLRSIEHNPYFDHRARKALEKLDEQKNGILLQKPLMESMVMDVGETFIIDLPLETAKSKTIRFTVAGSFINMPGIQESFRADFWTGLIMVNKAYVEEAGALPAHSSALVRIAEGSEPNQVLRQIMALDPSFLARSYSVTTALMRIEEDGEDETLLTLSSFSKLEFLFTIVMASFGLGLIFYTASQRRIGELGQQMARGMSGRQIITLLTSEGVVLTVVGVSIGCFAGIVPSYLYIIALARQGGLTITPQLVLPSIALIGLMAGSLALLTTSLVVSVKVARLRLHTVLRTKH